MAPRTVILLGATLLAACSHRVRGEADVEAGGVVKVSDDDAQHHYDPTQLTRTGITLDDLLASRCGVDERDAFFAFDSTKISDGADAVLEKLADCVTDGALAGRELQLIGYTDPRGSDAYNKQLGLSRAQSVAECLRGHGVPASGIELNSAGEAKADEKNPFDWPLERRVEIRLKDVEAKAPSGS